MTGSLAIASEVSGAAAALAGLILVFFGNALSSFDTYNTEQRNNVRWAYRRRAWPAFLGFAAAIFSCGLALYAKAWSDGDTAFAAVSFLGVAGVGVASLTASCVLSFRPAPPRRCGDNVPLDLLGS